MGITGSIMEHVEQFGVESTLEAVAYAMNTLAAEVDDDSACKRCKARAQALRVIGSKIGKMSGMTAARKASRNTFIAHC